MIAANCNIAGHGGHEFLQEYESANDFCACSWVSCGYVQLSVFVDSLPSLAAMPAQADPLVWLGLNSAVPETVPGGRITAYPFTRARIDRWDRLDLVARPWIRSRA
jgi:hypothetical protein